MLSILCNKKKSDKLKTEDKYYCRCNCCAEIFISTDRTESKPILPSLSTLLAECMESRDSIKHLKSTQVCRWKFNSPWSALAGLKIDANSVSLTLWERSEVKLKQSMWIYLPYNQINKIQITKRVLFLYNPRWLSVNYSL